MPSTLRAAVAAVIGPRNDIEAVSLSAERMTRAHGGQVFARSRVGVTEKYYGIVRARTV